MNAFEFVKKYGIDHAKAVVHGAVGFFDYWDYENLNYVNVDKGDCVAISELKRIVESHEIVEKCGGLKGAFYDYAAMTDQYSWSRLLTAIRDVEACQ